MRIGLSGRIGVGLVAFSALAYAVSELVRAIDNYQFAFYPWSDAFLLLIFIFGLTLTALAIDIALQGKHSADLEKFPLTTRGLPAQVSLQVSEPAKQGVSAAPSSSADAGEVSELKLIFIPLPSHRRLFTRIGRACVLLAVLVYFSAPGLITALISHHSRIFLSFLASYRQLYDVADLVFYILMALGITWILWPEVRETEELSLQGEVRSTCRELARGDRRIRRAMSVIMPLSSMRVWSYVWLMVLFILWIIFSTIGPLTPKGLLVYVPKPGTYALAVDKPWKEPLVLRIDAQDNMYLNLQLVQRAELKGRLKIELSQRADPPVFVDADPSLPTGEVIRAVDLIRGTWEWDTKVILITPSMKKETPELATEPPCEIEARQVRPLILPPNWHAHWDDLPQVTFDINEHGQVVNVKIQKAGNIPRLDEWVVQVVQKWSFAPALGCGKPLVKMYVPISPY